MADRISFTTTKDGVSDITPQLKEIVKNSGIVSGICVAFITHTTAGLTIASFWDPLGHEDIQDEIRRLIPTRVDFKHQHDTPEDAAGHVKSCLLGSSLSFIVENGEIMLGHSQGVYFLEFDGPRARECFVKVLGDAK